MTSTNSDNDASTKRMISRSEDNNSNYNMDIDKYFLVHILFYCLGVLSMIPNNFLVTANEYWMYKFRDTNYSNSTNSNNKTELQTQFTSNFNIICSVTQTLFLIVTIYFGKRITMKNRIIGTLSIVLLMFVLTITFVKIDTDSWQKGFFVITMIIAAIISGACSVFLITLFVMASKFPPIYLACMLSGQSICGIFAALVQIFSLSIGAEPETTALIYFMVAMFFILSTLIFYIFITKKSVFFQYQINQENKIVLNKITLDNIKITLNKIKYLIITLIIVLGCTIMVHPAVTSLVTSINKGHGNKWSDTFFVPVITFLSYNTAEFVGRELAGIIKKPSNMIITLILGICRATLVPLLLFCNVQPRHHLPVAFKSDTGYIISIILFAFTNGYLVNLCVIQIPKTTTKEEKDIATMLLFTFMIVSLGLCSFLSIALIAAV